MMHDPMNAIYPHIRALRCMCTERTRFECMCTEPWIKMHDRTRREGTHLNLCRTDERRSPRARIEDASFTPARHRDGNIELFGERGGAFSLFCATLTTSISREKGREKKEAYRQQVRGATAAESRITVGGHPLFSPPRFPLKSIPRRPTIDSVPWERAPHSCSSIYMYVCLESK